MNKKVVIIIIAFLSALAVVTLFYLNNKVDKNVGKFYLDSKYYGQDEFIEIDLEEFNKIKDNTYVLYVFNNFCNLPIPCHDIFDTYMKEKGVAFLSMKYEDFKKTKLHDKVKFAPSVIIIKDGKIIDYLDSEKDEDLDKYQDVKTFGKWIESYIKLK